MEKTTQTSTSSKTEENWKNSLELIRYQTDDNQITTGIIRQATFCEKEKVQLQVSPTGMDRTVQCTLDATIRPKQKSSFEKFLDQLGYDPTNKNLLSSLEGEQCDLKVTRNGKSNEFRIYTQLDNDRDDKPDNTSNSSLSKENIATNILTASLYGLIPFLNIIMLLIALHVSLEYNRDNNGMIDITEYYVVFGFSLSSILTYMIAILYLASPNII